MFCRTALILLLCVTAAAQDAPAPPGAAPQGDTAPDAPDALETSEQAVKVDAAADDDEIARRLRDIYDASERYTDLTVEVRDGIVFLTGRTTDDDYRDWASSLARRTQDVVAVVNNLTVVPPALDQHPIRQESVELWRGFVRSLPLIGVGLVLLVASLLLAGVISRLLTYPLRHITDSELLRNVARKLAAVLIVVGGVVLFLRVSGLTAVALTVVSGTGLFGLVIGFAFRDIAENFLASILLSIRTPFHLGDVIEVEGYTGVVSRVSARGTVLVDFQGNHIQIANATVYKSTIRNLTANPKMRLDFSLGIGYDASVTLAQATAVGILRDHDAVLDEPEPLVLVDSLGASTINLKVYFWINGHAMSALKVKSALMRQVLRGLESAGISMPDDAREIIFPQGVPVVREDRDGSTPGTAGSAPSPPLRKASAQTMADDQRPDATSAEGNLTSEVNNIREQAREARDPEGGPDVVGPNAG